MHLAPAAFCLRFWSPVQYGNWFFWYRANVLFFYSRPFSFSLRTLEQTNTQPYACLLLLVGAMKSMLQVDMIYIFTSLYGHLSIAPYQSSFFGFFFPAATCEDRKVFQGPR